MAGAWLWKFYALIFADIMLPEWLSIKPASTSKYDTIKNTIAERKLHTVCSEAHCPNLSECWSLGTATFMVLGGLCTRGCKFCAVNKSAIGEKPNPNEPLMLAKTIKEWNLDYVVITSVCRDDLEDQGAGHFADCITAIRKESPKTIIEVLIPDFTGNASYLKKITEAKPDVIGHNIETVKRISPQIRDKRADYFQSLNVLNQSKLFDKNIYTKSALMLGMGETEDEVLFAMDDLRTAKVDFLAIGQYLQPSKFHVVVKEYISPKKFDELKTIAMNKGFLYVASGPFVRSSYKAGEFFTTRIKENSIHL